MKGPPRARRAEIDFSLLYAGLFLALGAQMAFSQLWYQDRGLDAAEIGRLNTLAILTRIAAGVALPLIADATGRRAETLIGLALLGAAAALAHLAAPPGLGPGMIAVTLTLAVAYAGLLPLGDAYGFAAGEREGFSYRRARAVGSFAFLAATALVGEAVAGFGIDAVFVWIAVAMALAAAAAARARGAVDRAAAGDAEGADAAAAAGGAVGAEAPAPPGRPAARRLSLRGALALAADRRFALFLLAVSAVTASHAVYYVYGSIHWRSLGYSEPVIGRLWAWGVFAEIGLFWLGRSVMGRVRPEPALAIAAAAAAARWSAMTLDPGLAALAALQTLHAGSFALAHLAALAFIAEHAPPSARAAAQGLMSAAAGGLAMALAVEGAAALYPAAGAGAYWLGAAFAAVGVAAALALWRGRRRGGGAGGCGLSSARSGPLDGA